MRFLNYCLLAITLAAFPAFGIDVPSDGTDGAFTPVRGEEPWDPDGDGAVTIRPEQFSISDGRNFDARNGIFNWTEVVVPADITVLFRRDRLSPENYNPPVYFLAQNGIQIHGVLNLDGDSEGGIGAGHGAPGGFDGSAPGKRFHGPSQSRHYGSEVSFPPIGGGGDQRDTTVYGAGGAGAIVLATAGTIEVTGTIRAYGGAHPQNFDPGGGGGSVRLVADTINHTGSIVCQNGQGGFNGFIDYGPIRFEAFDIQGSGSVVGLSSIKEPTNPIFYESSASEPRLFIDRLVDNVGTELSFPTWDPTNPEVYRPLTIPATMEAPFTVVVRAENIDEGREVRVIAPTSTRTGVLALNAGNNQVEAEVLFDGANDFGSIEEVNSIYAELVIP